MASRQIHKLSARRAATLDEPGRHSDGGGLYLSISKVGGGRRWVFLYRRGGRLREMGLGSARDVTLARARELAAQARDVLARGGDPISMKASGSAPVTFADCTERLIQSQSAGWKNQKHRQQWANTLSAYAFPILGKVSVSEIGVAEVMSVIEPIWTTKTETASRVRGRIEAVLDWAKARGYRTGENPARWRGHLDKLLPNRSKVRKVKHHPALPYASMSKFFADLDKRTGSAAAALRFLIFTASRTNEVTGATWSEVDLKERTWTIPAERMKASRSHCVPLSNEATALLLRVRDKNSKPGDFLFPSAGSGNKALSNNAMLSLLARMGHSEITTHGFRSSFKDWARETTNFPRELAEAALAHSIKDKTEAAYARGTLFEKRRVLMDAWATHCMTDAGNSKVVPLARNAAG